MGVARLLTVALAVAACLLACRAADPKPLRILSLMTVDTMSHHLWMAPLTVELARRGHHVTSVDVAKPAEIPATLNVSVLENAFGASPDMVKRWMEAGLLRQMVFLNRDYMINECKRDLGTPTMQRLIDPANTQQFDLIIFDYMADCMLGIVHRFGYPGVVAVSPFPGSNWMDDLMGNPPLPGVLPMTVNPYPTPMTLWQRAATAGLYAWVRAAEAWYRPARERVMREVFGADTPGLQELRRSVHVALVNENPVMEPPRPMPPSMVAVGGMHVRPANLTRIPAHIRGWLDAAEDGFVLVSFGSIMKGANLDRSKLDAMVETFRALGAKVRVLWKMEEGVVDVSSLPPNVKVHAWLPQNDILGHPKLRLFVSHCGGLSTQEASYNGVPILGVPFIVDQFINLDKVVRLGTGRRMPYEELTKERFVAEVQTMLRDETYLDGARRLAELLRDQKETPLERAVWWAEYVGRQRGAPHLRSPVLDVPVAEALLVDVIALLVLAVLVVLLVVVAAVRACCRCFGRRSPRDLPSPKHSKTE